MGIDDIVNQGRKLIEDGKEKVADLLSSDEAEQVSDQVFDSAADVAKKIAPDQHDAAIEEFREKADAAVGSENAADVGADPPPAQ